MKLKNTMQLFFALTTGFGPHCFGASATLSEYVGSYKCQSISHTKPNPGSDNYATLTVSKKGSGVKLSWKNAEGKTGQVSMKGPFSAAPGENPYRTVMAVSGRDNCSFHLQGKNKGVMFNIGGTSSHCTGSP